MAKKSKKNKFKTALLLVLTGVVVTLATYTVINFNAIVDFAKTGKLYTHAQYEKAYKLGLNENQALIEQYQSLVNALRADLDAKDALIIELRNGG